MEPARAIILPGSLFPAQLAYGELIEALAPGVDTITKDLSSTRATSTPPAEALT